MIQSPKNPEPWPGTCWYLVGPYRHYDMSLGSPPLTFVAAVTATFSGASEVSSPEEIYDFRSQKPPKSQDVQKFNLRFNFKTLFTRFFYAFRWVCLCWRRSLALAQEIIHERSIKWTYGQSISLFNARFERLYVKMKLDELEKLAKMYHIFRNI